MDETKKKERNYEQIIIMKDKEIQNKKQLIEILEKDNQYLKNSMKRINNKGVTNDGNKLKKQNSEIMKIREKLQNYKKIISEHNFCGKIIDYLIQNIQRKKAELANKKNEGIKKELIVDRMNTKLNLIEQAIVKMDDNITKRKLEEKEKERKKLEKLKELEQSQKNQNSAKKYTKTLPSNNNTNIRNQILKNKKQLNNLNLNNLNTESNTKNKNNKNSIVEAYTEEEKNKAIKVFTEEELNIIMKMMNNNEERYNALVEKLVVLERFRYARKKQLKVKMRQNNQKKQKISEDFSVLENKLKYLEKDKGAITKKLIN